MLGYMKLSSEYDFIREYCIMSSQILVTGCCGFIGSHTCVELLTNGYDVVGIDNFSNSKKNVLTQITKITGKHIKFYEGDLLDEVIMDCVFKENNIVAVVDFAAYKAVGESISEPIKYYINNVSSVLNLVKSMQKYEVRKLIFSSTATVYGVQNEMPISEKSIVGNTTNPYGTSKLFVEKILNDLYVSNNNWDICIFRYFNPVGAHESGYIGEEPLGKAANLMPLIVDVANGKLDKIVIYGNDYDTIDGTGIRDYIHVVDLAKAHVLGIDKIINGQGGYNVYNLGTGKGYSVLEIVDTFEKVNNVEIDYIIGERRDGDVPVAYADASKAEKELGWKALFGIEKMCVDSYNFAKKYGKD